MMKGNILIYTGNGGGKTTAALGLAMRAVGHNQKAVVIQFMKGWKNTGEYLIKSRLKDNYEIKQFGRKEFVNLKKPSVKDKTLAKKGLLYARKKIAEKPCLLVLDEINLVASIGLLDKKEVLEMLKFIPSETITILTGRNAPKEFIDYADYAVEVRDIKRPKKTLPPRKGFEY